MFFISPLVAGPSASVDPGFLQFMPLLLVAGIMIFFTMRSQKKRETEKKKLLDSLKIGDVVLTQGGLIGKIVSFVEDTEVLLELAPDVVVRYLKDAVVSHVQQKETKQLRAREREAVVRKNTKTATSAKASKKKTSS